MNRLVLQANSAYKKKGIHVLYRGAREHVKQMGRCHGIGDTLWLAMSGSGIESRFIGRHLERFHLAAAEVPAPYIKRP